MVVEPSSVSAVADGLDPRIVGPAGDRAAGDRAIADAVDVPDDADGSSPGSSPATGPLIPAQRSERRAQHVAKHRPWPSPRQQIATGVMVLGIGLALILLGHRILPTVAGFASFLETWLPWLAAPIAALLVSAALVRSRRALIAAVIAAGVWGAGYGPQLLPHGANLPANLRIVSEDVNASSAELSASGSVAAAQRADLVILEDVYPVVATAKATAGLNASYANHINQYEFGVWSTYPITAVSPIGLGTTTNATSDHGLASGGPQELVGALRVTFETPKGPLVVYAVHIPQPDMSEHGFATTRDASIARLNRVIAADHAPLLAVVGCLNVATTDREFGLLTGSLGLSSAQKSAGSGFGFTWPAEFPVVRLDDVLVRGATPVRSVVLGKLAGGQTHLPIEVDLHLS